MLKNILIEQWLSEKEANIYLACLELWEMPASSVARKLWENRVATYTILKSLCERWIAYEMKKNNVKHYNVIPPKNLIELQEQKLNKLKESLPEMVALINEYSSKPKVYFYEWIEQLKKLMLEIVTDGYNMWDDPYLTFVWTADIDPEMQKWLDTEFVKLRLKNKTKTKAIISKKILTKYSDYHEEKHDSVLIDDPIFNMENETVLYNWKVAMLLYSTDEMSWVVIESKTLYNSLKSMFNLLRKTFKK